MVIRKGIPELDNEFEDAIVINNTELIEILTDVHSSLESYMADMQSYIAPENSAALCRVDRNDIAWNIMQISQLPYGYVGEHPCVLSHYYWDEFENPLSPNVAEVHARNEERRRKRERNYNKLVSFYQNTLANTAKELSEEVNKINDIHEKYVVVYENTDDIYKSNLATLYDSIKTWKDIFEDACEFVTDILRGFGTGVIDLIKGLKAPLEIVLALNPAIPLPLGVRVALLYDGGKDLYAASKAFIEDPENTVGAIFQNMADTSDEEGVAFTAGYAIEKAAEIILAKKLGELMEGSGAAEAEKISEAKVATEAEKELARTKLVGEVKEIRANMPNTNLAKRGNVAVAEVDIPGVKENFAAHSKINYAVDKGADMADFSYLKPEGERIFTTYVEDQFPRFHDTEAKILEDIASQIPDANVSGTVNLYSELPCCQSCSNLILEFRRMFPNIKLNVFVE